MRMPTALIHGLKCQSETLDLGKAPYTTLRGLILRQLLALDRGLKCSLRDMRTRKNETTTAQYISVGINIMAMNEEATQPTARYHIVKSVPSRDSAAGN